MKHKDEQKTTRSGQSGNPEGSQFEDRTHTTASLRKVGDNLMEEGHRRFESGKNKFTDSLNVVSDGLKLSAEELKQADNPVHDIVRQGGDLVEDFSQRVRRTSARELQTSVTDFCRENPTVSLMVSFGLGISIARFLKTEPEQRHEDISGAREREPEVHSVDRDFEHTDFPKVGSAHAT